MTVPGLLRPYGVEAKGDDLATDSLLGQTYTTFVEDTQPRLRQALVARLGPDEGSEATAEALAYGWEHWERIERMENPAGYLYRVGCHKGMHEEVADVMGVSVSTVRNHLRRGMEKLRSALGGGA